MLEKYNRNLIYHVLKKNNLYYRKEELYDLGLIGLTKAINTYNNDKGIRFSTYAYTCIQNEIKQELRKENGIKRKANNCTISLNKEINCANDNIELQDLIQSNTNIEEEYEKKETIKELYININKLNKREKKLICYYYGINCDKKNQEELSIMYNISQAQVSRRIKAILKKLRGFYEDNY